MNTRVPPPHGSPPANSCLSRFYRSDLRLAVIGASVITAIWSISAAIGFYRNIGPYNDNGAPGLATISIIVGSLYMGVFVIGIYGVSAAVTRKPMLVRIFAYLSALAVILVAGINLFRIVIHFTMRKTILDACANVSTGDTFFYGGWWGPLYSDTLTPGEARAFCTRYYDRDSWSMILGFIILTIIGIFFSVIAFLFLRQTLDPLGPGNVMRDQQRTAGSQFYSPPYNNNNNNTGFGQSYSNFAPPPGPPPFPYSGPPGRGDDTDSKPPEYGWEYHPDMQHSDMQKKRDEENGPKTGDVRF